MIFEVLEARRQQVEQVEQNSARPARLTLAFDTNGEGELLMPSPVEFGLHFLDLPAVSTGVQLRAGELVAGKYPNVCAGVYRWDRTDKGFYIGARLFFVVDSGGQPYELTHFVTFEATAMKYVPGDLEL